jgi:hypothetical protein
MLHSGRIKVAQSYICGCGQEPTQRSTRVGFGLTYKHCTRPEGLARDKHSSLLRTLVNYGRNFFYILGARLWKPSVANMFESIVCLRANRIERFSPNK